MAQGNCFGNFTRKSVIDIERVHFKSGKLPHSRYFVGKLLPLIATTSKLFYTTLRRGQAFLIIESELFRFSGRFSAIKSNNNED